jgi:hypothetical protein
LSRLANLAQWIGPTTGLRSVGQYADASAKPEGEDYRPAVESYIHAGGAESYGWSDGNDEMRRPGERLNVYGLGTAQAYVLAEIVLTSRSLAEEAAALSFMRTGPYDVRPWLLLAMYGESERAIGECLAHGVRYLAAWCKANDEPRGEAAIKAAAADALGVLYVPRAPRTGAGSAQRTTPAADARAQQLRMRAKAYRDLRRVALRMYRRRLKEACVQFHVGRIHTRESPYSLVGKMIAPPAHLPRALPRDIGQQLFPWAA